MLTMKPCKDESYLIQETGSQIHRMSTRHDSSWKSMLFMSALLGSLAVWNSYLTWTQIQLTQQISSLQIKQANLEGLCQLRTSVDDYDSDMNDYDTNDDSELDDELDDDDVNPSSHTGLLDTFLRVRRDAPTDGSRTRSKKDKNKKKKNKNKKNKSGAAHFVAYIDEDRQQREIAEGKTPSAGNFTDHGLSPTGRIYNFWREEVWTNKRLFQLNSTSGKVKVNENGLYLIYGQMMFHGPTARKSYGIHINDEVVPFIESLSFDSNRDGMAARLKRDTSSYDPDPYVSQLGASDPYIDQSANEHSLRHSGRHRRSGYASYSQCNTIAVAHLTKGDEVFLKSLEFARSVIPRKYLTFWGMAKL